MDEVTAGTAGESRPSTGTVVDGSGTFARGRGGGAVAVVDEGWLVASPTVVVDGCSSR